MRIPESTFDDLLAKHGTLSVPDISQASKSHTYVRELLANKSESDLLFPRLVEGDFLSGSYARGTKNPPLNDIDVMMPIDGAGFFPIRNGIQWNAVVRGSEKFDNPLLRQLDVRGLLSSRRVMELFQKGLEDSYPSSTVAKDGQAVNVWLDSYGFGIDIVPCFHVIPMDGSQDVYYIPAGSQSDGWTLTNPKVDQRISDALHEHHDKKLKPVVKLIKLWNDLKNGGRLRPYHLETICWYVFDAYPGKITHPGLAVIHFFQNAAQHLQALCPDATRIGGHIDSYLSYEDRQHSIGTIQQAASVLSNAYLLGLADENRQISGFRSVYGDNFARS